MSRRNWTRDELLVAFNLYCKLPFSITNANRKEVKELAELIGRTPAAVCWKLVNFASFNPSLQAQGIKGASNSSKADKAIFEEFSQNWDKMIYESELLLQKFKIEKGIQISNLKNDENHHSDFVDNFLFVEKEGIVTERIVKVRVNQNFFRKMILSSYDNKCCLTGINIPNLLVASDKGFITIDMDYKVKISKSLKDLEKNKSICNFFLTYENQPIELPSRFLPSRKFLDYYHKNIFRS